MKRARRDRPAGSRPLHAGPGAGVRLLLAAAIATTCARATPERAAPRGRNDPVIHSLEPVSGPAGTGHPVRVLIRGARFDPADNVVGFGPVRLPHLPSTAEGTRITFFAPKEVPSAGEAPPAVLLPGRYAVTVTTAGGASDTAYFTFTRPGRGP